MSAGAFVLSFYEADDDEIFPIRVQPETLAASIGAVNAGATGPATVPVFARTGGGRREYGRKTRSVSVKFTGAVPDGYATDRLLRIPIMTSAVFSGIDVGDTGTYLGVGVQVVGKSSESGR